MSAQITQELHTIRDWIRWVSVQFQAARLFYGHGTDNAKDEAIALMCFVSGVMHDELDNYLDCRLTTPEKNRAFDLVEQRINQRVPLPYLTGEAWFAGLKFAVTRDTLIPRSPIAELIVSGFEPWVDAERELRVLDMCTGGGCIAIACKVHWPHWQVSGADISKRALELARENAEKHGVGQDVAWANGDLFASVAGQKFDLIVSNPPYVGDLEMGELPAEYGHEPDMALRSAGEGLEIPLRILTAASEYLTESGVLVLEVGNSMEALDSLCPFATWTWLEFERGGHGVLAIDRAALLAHHADFMNALRRI